MSDPRERTLRVPIVVFAAILMLVALLGIVHRSGVERSRREIQARVGAWQTELDELDRTRDVLWGETTEGEAWGAYARAFSELRKVSGADRRTTASVNARSAGEPDDLDTLLSECAPALDAMRRGTHLSRGTRVLDWKKGASVRTSRLMDARTLANLSVVRFRDELAAGDQVEALQSILDALQFGRDHAAAFLLIDEMIGVAVLDISVDGIVDDDAWTSLNDTSLRRLAGALTTIDEDLSLTSNGLRADLILLTHTLDGLGASEFDNLFNGGGWFIALSWQSQMAECTEIGEDAIDEYERICTRPCADRMKEVDDVFSVFERSSNPFMTVMPKLASATRSRLGGIAELRMLRIAIAHRLGEELELENPFGPDFIVVNAENRLRISTPFDQHAAIDVLITDD